MLCEHKNSFEIRNTTVFVPLPVTDNIVLVLSFIEKPEVSDNVTRSLNFTIIVSGLLFGISARVMPGGVESPNPLSTIRVIVYVHTILPLFSASIVILYSPSETSVV